MITPREFGEKMARCWKGYEPVPGKKPYSEDSCRPVGSKKKKKSEKKAAQPYQNKLLDAQVPAYKARVAGAATAMDKLMGKKPKPPAQAPISDVAAKPGVKGASAKNAPEAGQKMAGSPAWQKSDGKNPEGGLNEKGRKSYERETGGNLKAPVTESNPKGERYKNKVPKPPLPGAVMAQPRATGLGASQPAGSGSNGPAVPAAPTSNLPVPPVTPPAPQPSGLTQPIPQNPPRI